MPKTVEKSTETLANTPDEEYQLLLRSLRRRRGFGLLFVESTPVGGLELIAKIKRDLPQKKMDTLSLERPIANLIEKVESFPDQDKLNILFITSLEKSLVEYIRPGYGGKGDYYNLDDIPPILSHLNWQRENFRDQFRHICFVFILPKYAIKYISLRAPDFFDWGSGVFVFPDNQMVSVPTIKPRISKLLEWLGYGLLGVTTIILLLINLSWPILSLLLPFLGTFIGFLFSGIIKAIRLKQDNNFVKSPFIKLIWRGIRATQFGILGEFINKPKNALSYFDNAIKLDPFYHQAWNNRGTALLNLGRYEEAISSYDEALKIKPDKHEAWYNRGTALLNLGRYEEAITSYDNALKIKSDNHEAWYNRGGALDDLGRYEEAITSYDNALRIKPDKHEAWYNQGTALFNLGRYEEAITSYDNALKIKPDNHEAWNNRGYALLKMGNYQKAIEDIDESLKINPHPLAYESKAYTYILLDEIDLAIENIRSAIEIDPSRKKAILNDPDFDKIRNDSRFINLINSQNQNL